MFRDVFRQDPVRKCLAVTAMVGGSTSVKAESSFSAVSPHTTKMLHPQGCTRWLRGSAPPRPWISQVFFSVRRPLVMVSFN